MIINAAVTDMEKKEHFVETYFSTEKYKNMRTNRKNNNSPFGISKHF